MIPLHCSAATLTRPADGRLMSRYGMRRGRTTGEMRLHAGIDVGAPEGTPIYAPVPGRVALVGVEGGGRTDGLHGYGHCVVLDDGDGHFLLFAHLALVEPGVVAGARLEAGELLGYVGRTTDGKFPGMVPHLHLEVRTRDARGAMPFPGPYGTYNVDPQVYLAQVGIGFDRDGQTWEPSVGACPSGPGPHEERPRIASLPLTASALELRPAAAEYEPPVPDPDWYREASPVVRGALWFGLVGLGVLGVGAALRDA